MRLLMWYCDLFEWHSARQSLPQAPAAEGHGAHNAVVAFIHVEPADIETERHAETKLIKNLKWLARKWRTQVVVLHSFSHLAENKAPPEDARKLFVSARSRLEKAGYTVLETPYGFFNDLLLKAPGHPLARIYKAF